MLGDGVVLTLIFSLICFALDRLQVVAVALRFKVEFRLGFRVGLTEIFCTWTDFIAVTLRCRVGF